MLRVNGDDDGPGKALAQQSWLIDGFPTFVLLDAQAREIDRFSGYSEPREWAADLTQALLDRSTIEEKERRFESEPSARLAERLGDRSASQKQYEAAIARYRVGQSLEPSRRQALWERILRVALRAFEEGAGGFDRARVLAIAREPFAGPALDPQSQASAALQLAQLPASFDNEVVGPLLERALAASEHASGRALVRSRAELLVIKALRFDHDPAAAVAPRREAMPDGWQQDPFQINEFAWWCFQQEVNTEQAYQLALSALELLPSETPGERRSMILDTAAELALRRGDRGMAVALWKQAAQAEPSNDHFATRLAAAASGVTTQ